MAVLKFPPVQTADENGLLALGGDLEVSTLVLAYRNGIFPWPISDEFPLAWFSPDPRGVLDFQNLKLSKRFQRYLLKTELEFTCNQDFEGVITNCSRVPRNQQSGTWITSDVIQGYNKLFEQGLAYSIEAWDKNQLVGGVYGVCIDGILTGESMFHLVPNSSKFSLCVLLLLLKKQEITWLDTQMVTPVVKSLGGKEISRAEFLDRMKALPLKSRKEIFPEKFNKEEFLELCR